MLTLSCTSIRKFVRKRVSRLGRRGIIGTEDEHGEDDSGLLPLLCNEKIKAIISVTALLPLVPKDFIFPSTCY